MSGELKPGMKIPSENELAQSFGVGRSTVREAVRILVAYGILEIRRADGTYVCDRYSPRILDPMLYGIILQKDNAHHELIELRKMIDSGILEQLFYSGITPETIDKLNEKQDDLEAYLRTGKNDVKIIAQKDIAFHKELALATNNLAVVDVYSSIVTITEDFLYKTIELIIQKDAVAYFSDSHRGIMEKLQGKSLEDLHDKVEKCYTYWRLAFDAEKTQ